MEAGKAGTKGEMEAGKAGTKGEMEAGKAGTRKGDGGGGGTGNKMARAGWSYKSKY